MLVNNCETCGIKRNPAATPGNCKSCYLENLKSLYMIQWDKQLIDIGITLHRYIEYKGSHSKVEVTNNECGHIFVAKLNNMLSAQTKCGICGPTNRVKAASIAYKKKYGRNYDLDKWKGYLLEVRAISDQIYNSNKTEMNPDNYPRTKPNNHPDAVNLDHIIPIIYGFKNNLPISLIADKRNLRIVPARFNLKKKQQLTEEAENLLTELLLD